MEVKTYMITIKHLQSIILANIWRSLPDTEVRYTKFDNAAKSIVKITEENLKPEIDDFVLVKYVEFVQLLEKIFSELIKEDSFIQLNTPLKESDSDVMVVSIGCIPRAERDFIDIYALQRNSIEDILNESFLEMVEE